MVETISPVVYGTRTRWVGAVLLHAAATLLGAPWGRAGAVIVVAVAVPYLAREVTGVRIPVPQLRRQVPDWWRTYFGRPLAAFLYGAGLGVGFLTFLGHGTLVAVTAGVAATGRPLLGALMMAPFGLARGLAPIVAARSTAPEDGRSLVDRLSSMSGHLRRAFNALALIGIVVAAAASVSRTAGGWGEAAAAALAVTFAWATVSKLTGWRRWRGILSAQALPPRIERLAASAVPAVEWLVPVLTVVGRERAAAAVAVGSLVIFSAALLRLAARDGLTVACGCFGRASIDVRVALARNLALAVTAVVAWSLASPDPRVAFPGATDALPALLVAGGLVVAALTAWRSTVWLGKGRA